MNLSISLTGDKHVELSLSRLKNRLSDDLTPAFDEVAKDLKQFEEDEVFPSQGGALGAGWAPLTESTLKYKPQGLGILQRTGLLERSFISLIEPTAMFFTNNVEYASYHQTGTSKMVARPIYAVNEPVAALIGRAFQRYMVRVVDEEWHG